MHATHRLTMVAAVAGGVVSLVALKFQTVVRCTVSLVALKFQSHFFLRRIQTLHPHTMSISSITSIARLVVNLFIDPTVDDDEYDDVIKEVVDKEMQVTQDYFIELGFTDTLTKHSLCSRHDLRDIPDKNTIVTTSTNLV